MSSYDYCSSLKMAVNYFRFERLGNDCLTNYMMDMTIENPLEAKSELPLKFSLQKIIRDSFERNTNENIVLFILNK